MKCSSHLSTEPDLSRSIAEATASVREELGAVPDLAFVFFSADRAVQAEWIANQLCDRLETDHLLGCCGESVVGRGQEVEQEPAFSLWAARLPDVSIQLMHLTFERTPDGGTIVGWSESLTSQWPEEPAMMLLGEPFSFPADYLLERMNEDHPGVPVLGGMASGGAQPGDHRIILGRETHSSGAVSVLLHGRIRVESIVSQGCRPIGKPMVITRAEQNVIQELGGRAALLQLKEIFDQLPNSDQALVQQGLHLGRVISEYQDHFEQGDFLVRNVLGIDPDQGSIAVGDYMRTGQTVQFHVRDDKTADVELRQLLKRSEDRPASGALLFTCNGRGTKLFPEPHHDALAIRETHGNVALAGFFAQGELGPVGKENFMHGFTASVALLREPDGTQEQIG